MALTFVIKGTEKRDTKEGTDKKPKIFQNRQDLFLESSGGALSESIINVLDQISF
jgi:hypothetical protein